ncbi:carnitine O-palmitoyltransferase 1, liver isoform [Bicyclus anynana]|uniref:Carnitine O-palmitoyltransferase 1, liver isoform n=1 Tax=Bicyclus anynana TaxID=110368 RepID=A0ABM3M5Z2_BICAN|nr:carnitine O-palmitoyltransferase 1, liver isoform [Bicyclus anynana]
MAEAHSAVAFSFAITHDGWDVNFDREVLYLVWESGLRSWKKRLARFRNSIHNGVYPGHLQSLYFLWTVLAAAHFAGFDIPFGLVQKALTLLPSESTPWQVVACLLAALAMWLSVIFLMRYALKLLLMYKGWMYESRAPGSKLSLRTVLWASVVKVLSGWNKPRLYSFQGSLPRLPLPAVADTMRRVRETKRMCRADVRARTVLWASVVKVLSGWNKPRLYSFQGSLPRLPLPAVADTMRRVRETKRMCRADVRARTVLWASVVKVLSGWNKPRLYSFQGSLPRLPLPAVADTMRRYLLSVRPLLDDDNYRRVEGLAKEFEEGIAVKLQRYLVLKSWWSSNYVSDWWEEYVYLRGRSPLMVNSNFYGTDTLLRPTRRQAARAATVIHFALRFRRLIERQELEPIMLQGMVPLCSWQYERLFNTVRVPGVERDRIVHYQDSAHVSVHHRGRYYKLLVYARGRLLNPAEIQTQLQQILSDEAEAAPGEVRLAALTAGERSHWAHVRQTMFQRGHNRTSLHCIERAAFHVSLDCMAYGFDESDVSRLDEYGRVLLHGAGHDRWFDKSFNLCFSTDGSVGFNTEHTWADAPVMGHLWEYVMWSELEYGYDSEGDARGEVSAPPPPPVRLAWELSAPLLAAVDASHGVADALLRDLDLRILMFTDYGKGQYIARHRHDSEGDARGEVSAPPPPPVRLAWELSAPLLAAVDASHGVADALLRDLDLRILMFTDYGKGFMKSCRISPDAFIQMILQLSYRRAAGRFCLTYEASMTRLYREGRTETVRSCTLESVAWVQAMQDPASSVEERVKLLRVAAARHQLGYQDAMAGRGIDRHLFCLYVVSKYLELESPFLQEVFNEPWRLSTSQTPHGQTSLLDLKKYPKCVSAGGGFGPVADDGYGVSYIIAGEDTLFFHVSSKLNCPVTSSSEFVRQIERSLRDVRQLFADYRNMNLRK